LLPELRAAILAKYPAVEFDAQIEWIAEPAGDMYYFKPDKSAPDGVERREAERAVAAIEKSEPRQVALREAVAQQATDARSEIRALAARQKTAVDEVEQERAAIMAVAQERLARPEPTVEEIFREIDEEGRRAAADSKPDQ
jgi:hypothetical protein